MKMHDPRPSIHKPDANSKKSMPAPATEGLGVLDQDRAGSVADEGGASAATVEAEESPAGFESRKKRQRRP